MCKLLASHLTQHVQHTLTHNVDCTLKLAYCLMLISDYFFISQSQQIRHGKISRFQVTMFW